MISLESSFQEKFSIMEGYGQYLIERRRMPQNKAEMYINLVRKFHNYVGKSYIDVEEDDIRNYLSCLGEVEHFKARSLYIHLAAIKKFYDYLRTRGDVGTSPSDGISMKDLQKLRSAHKIEI